MNSSIYLLILILTIINTVTSFSNLTIDEIPESYLNLTSGNELWTSLIRNCRKPTINCVEKTMFEYLQDTLQYPSDFQIYEFLKFKKNNLDYNKIKNDYYKTHNGSDADNNSDLSDEPRSSIEEMSRSLHDKSVNFLMTHDVELQLPEFFFDGTILKISPRSLETNGAMIKMEFLPQEKSEGRIFFKKIKQHISQKLVYALLAILLVIKLLAAKFMFLMPMAVGAVTAKKLLIKVLLFLFPALHHLFKLCPYTPHGTKFHHHKHQISHIHHISPHHHHHGHHHHKDGIEIIHPHADGPPFLHDDHEHGHHGSHDGVEIIHPHADGPPILHGGASLHHFSDHEPPHKKLYNPHEQELEYWSGGAALSNHFMTHDRQDATTTNDDNELMPWGQGQSTKKKQPAFGRPLQPSQIEAMVLKAEREQILKAKLQQERLRIQEENARLQDQLRKALKLQEKLRQHAALVQSRISNPAPVPSKLQPPPPPSPMSPPVVSAPVYYNHDPVSSTVPPQTPHVEMQQPDVVNPVTAANIPQSKQDIPQHNPQKEFEKALYQAATITYDPFYSPILAKIDEILVGLNIAEEPCKERLICSMYKNPTKFSPHSNLLSAELSRDPKELQKPTTTNAAVVRFYRYVQAARDGQDQRDCLRLYTSCSINTEEVMVI